MVYLDGKVAVAAIAASVRYILKNPLLALQLSLLYLGVGLVAGQVPVLGLMFNMALHVRAHRELFGDGPA
jgi:hypothetical protein